MVLFNGMLSARKTWGATLAWAALAATRHYCAS